MAEHKHGEMDITEQKKTFEGFMKMWVWIFALSAAVLLFLAIFNS